MVNFLVAIAMIALAMASTYVIGKHLSHTELKAKIKTHQRVQRNLNALVIEQRRALDEVDGLWATDNVRLIKHHGKKEQFFRIGHPKDRL